jgi:hypothetical protein
MFLNHVRYSDHREKGSDFRPGNWNATLTQKHCLQKRAEAELNGFPEQIPLKVLHNETLLMLLKLS